MKVLAILQARFSSSRLPGKVLKPILGEPMLLRQVERIRRVKGIDEFVLATSEEASDDPVAQMCVDNGIECFRGSLDDVLDRFYSAAKKYSPENVVRLTGDCPLIDPQVLQALIDLFFAGGYDYASNCLTPTYPDGLDAEVMRFEVLEQAWQSAELQSEREHVTPYIYKHPQDFKLGVLKNAEDLSALRWTVDEPEDYELVCRIYEALYPQNPEFGFSEILNFVRSNKELLSVNDKFTRNEGYSQSLEKDNV